MVINTIRPHVQQTLVNFNMRVDRVGVGLGPYTSPCTVKSDQIYVVELPKK